MSANPYNTDLDRTPANFQPLTPLTFLERAAMVFQITQQSSMGRCAVAMRRFMRARASWRRHCLRVE